MRGRTGAGSAGSLIKETPDMTLPEIAAHLENEHGLRVSSRCQMSVGTRTFDSTRT